MTTDSKMALVAGGTPSLRPASGGWLALAGTVDGGEEQLGGERLDPIASPLGVPLNRAVHLEG